MCVCIFDGRSELSRYVRDIDDKALRRQAERIHLQTSTTTPSTGPTTNSTSTTEISKMETCEYSPIGYSPTFFWCQFDADIKTDNPLPISLSVSRYIDGPLHKFQIKAQ